MANNIQILSHFVPIMDEKYTKESLTAVLDTPEAQLLANGKMQLPKLTSSGFRNHTRAGGGQYKRGNVQFETVEVAPNYDRSIIMGVDYLDNTQTADVAFGKLSNYFITHQEVPEVDAWRFAQYANITGVETVAKVKPVDGLEAIEDLRKIRTYFDNNKVPETERVLYGTPEAINAIEDMQTIESRAALNSFGLVIKVPQDLFMDKITLLDDEDGGWERPVGAKNITFLGIHKSAIIQGNFHRAPKFIPADGNQNADGHEFALRLAGIVHVFDEKTEGVYVQTEE